MKAAIIKDGKVVNIAKVADAEFAESQGWVVSDTARIGDIYDPDTGQFSAPPRWASLEEAQAAAIQSINDGYTEAVAPLIKGYPNPESLSWAHQDTEAQAYLAWRAAGEQGDPPATPVLDAILAGRNEDGGTETLYALCQAVEANAEQFRQAQVLTGRRQRLVKKIRAAESVGEVEEVQWE